MMEYIVAILVISNLLAWRALYYAHYRKVWFGKVTVYCGNNGLIGIETAHEPTLSELCKDALKGRLMSRLQAFRGSKGRS